MFYLKSNSVIFSFHGVNGVDEIPYHLDMYYCDKKSRVIQKNDKNKRVKCQN